MPTVVNLGENIGKWVGKTRADDDPFFVHARLLQATGRLAPRIPYPRGTFRFKTHEEAHEWQWNHMIKAATRMKN
jgi:hypothetical protein